MGRSGTYLGLVGDKGQGSRNSDRVDNGGPGVARGPAEVLVSVGVELWIYVSDCWVLSNRLYGGSTPTTLGN